jgi:general secretion pathway protein L
MSPFYGKAKASLDKHMKQEKLIIFLPAQDLSHPDWAVIDAASIVTRQTLGGDPAELAHAAKDREVIVVVPAEDVLLTSVTLPKMSRSRLAQALPFALEDQLVGDIDTLHFAWGEVEADGSMPVVITAREKMQQWLTLLQSWHVQPDHLIPAVLALPYSLESWHVMIAGMAYARIAQFKGFACDLKNLDGFINLAVASAPHLPHQIHIHNYASVSAVLRDETITVHEEMLPPQRLIADLARNAAHAPALNLLQGTHAVRKSRFPQMKKMTRALAVLAMVWISLLFIYPTVSYFILSQRINSVDAQIAQLYKRNFPQSGSIVAPKLRMEEKLQKLTSQIGENRFLLLLGYTGKGMQEASAGITLKRIDFQNNQLTLELTAQSSENFSAFTDYLNQQGLNVKQQNANLAGTRVNATVVIE